jgi:16S rRNA (adenine1518-N6/adenine1519-N6)-dimethyltransferase
MKRGGAKLGQHFLKHAWAAKALAYAVNVQPGETILEIGPGKGVLTRELLKFGNVIAIEKDAELIALLKQTFSAEVASDKLHLVSADIRDVTPQTLGLTAGTYVLAANIPYYITGEIIRQFLTADFQPRAMALLIQKEVAQRITSAKESILSLSVKAYGTPKITEKVSRTQFSPPPSVDSAILAVTGISKQFFTDISEEDFFRVVHAGFASKRKLLSNNLSVVFEKGSVKKAFATAGVDEKARAEEVTLGQWKELATLLTK